MRELRCEGRAGGAITVEVDPEGLSPLAEDGSEGGSSRRGRGFWGFRLGSPASQGRGRQRATTENFFVGDRVRVLNTVPPPEGEERSAADQVGEATKVTKARIRVKTDSGVEVYRAPTNVRVIGEGLECRARRQTGRFATGFAGVSPHM